MELEALRKDMVAAMKAKDKVTKDQKRQPILQPTCDEIHTELP